MNAYISSTDTAAAVANSCCPISLQTRIEMHPTEKNTIKDFLAMNSSLLRIKESIIGLPIYYFNVNKDGVLVSKIFLPKQHCTFAL